MRSKRPMVNNHWPFVFLVPPNLFSKIHESYYHLKTVKNLGIKFRKLFIFARFI
jgi:hypothetical protein